METTIVQGYIGLWACIGLVSARPIDFVAQNANTKP